uniref:Reverse transcriptase domain-containing protein n=1 Tax=Cannabis sativa TaxID=3483 RepID=A0A803Q4Z4_CANSA
MHSDKSPGPDGFNLGFYQKPETMSDLRPISLCNVIYKIVSKVLITDNILISFEIMHYLKRKSSGNEGVMAIKLDMSKACDRVEWNFLQAMLKKMGFSDHWIHLVMGCVRSVSYHILLEGQSALISDFERQGKLRGCKVARGAPVITHTFFADDSYLYYRATEKEAHNVMELLQCFQLASGQQVNLNKSSIFFSANTGVDIRARICSILKVQEVGESMRLYCIDWWNALLLGLAGKERELELIWTMLELLHEAKSMLEKWPTAQDKFQHSTAAFLTADDGAEVWQKQVVREVKINVDVALFSDPNMYSFACVARDEPCHVLEAISCCKQGNVAPELAEAIGLQLKLIVFPWFKRFATHFLCFLILEV